MQVILAASLAASLCLLIVWGAALPWFHGRRLFVSTFVLTTALGIAYASSFGFVTYGPMVTGAILVGFGLWQLLFLAIVGTIGLVFMWVSLVRALMRLPIRTVDEISSTESTTLINEHLKETAMKKTSILYSSGETVVSLAALAVVLGVCWFFIDAVVFGNVRDFNIAFNNIKIAPEVYPAALLLLWAMTQRMRDDVITSGDGSWNAFLRWEDKYESFFLALAASGFAVWAFTAGRSSSMIAYLVIFAVGAIWDALLSGEEKKVAGVPGTALPNQVEHVMNVKTITTHTIQMPNGEERPWDPTKFIEQQKAIPPAAS